MDLATGVTTAKYGFDLVKGLIEVLRGDLVDHHEISNRLMEIQQMLLDLQAALGDGHEQIRTLRGRLAAIDEAKALQADLEYVEDGHYLVRKSEIQKSSARYCPVCWGDQQKLVPLMPIVAGAKYYCQIHKQSHMTNAHIENERRRQEAADRVHLGGSSESWLGR